MSIIGSFNTATLEGLVTALSKATQALTAPLGEYSVAERNLRLENAQKARVALDAYIASIA